MEDGDKTEEECAKVSAGTYQLVYNPEVLPRRICYCSALSNGLDSGAALCLDRWLPLYVANVSCLNEKEADKQRNRNRLQILGPRCGSEMELLLIAYLKDNELWMTGGWHWIEQRLAFREMMLREDQKREEESAQSDSLSALGLAA